jgi:pyridinium-3,5-bisthiocarboxylic acid mononucleotide nickel chelatase
MKKKTSSVWMVQADHLSGESLGSVLETLLDLGALNVHISPTITKKNRPGHIIFIDVGSSTRTQEDIAKYLVSDLGIYGHHRILTEHYYEMTDIVDIPVIVESAGNSTTLSVKLKIIRNSEEESFPRAEHDSLVSIQREIQSTLGVRLSLREIATAVESSFPTTRDHVMIVINGSHRHKS